MIHSLKQYISILLLLAFGISGIFYPFVSANKQNSPASEFSQLIPVDHNFYLEHGLNLQIDHFGVTKSNQSDYQFDFSALLSARLALEVIFDLKNTSWLKNPTIFFDVLSLLYPFHHFW
ncbi:hypothetical protein [Shivajiella indica]|uniref:Uncharacterized protein n=1 Tax=Shivajiella indica TaxID=872115 RepID=A0ABW5B8I7_9BACT